MQQLAESLANELWTLEPAARTAAARCSIPYPITEGLSRCRGCEEARRPPDGHPTAIPPSCDSLFSFAKGPSSSLNFSVLEPQQDGSIVSNLPPSEKRGGRRATSSVQEHVIAERKRREKMHQQFATLASIVPDITKTDKVSVLGSTIEYVHNLKEKVKVLQDSQSFRSTAESLTLDAGSGDDDDDGEAARSLGIKIEANVRGETLLLRVVCPENKGVLIKVLTELEKHGMSTMNTNLVPFAGSSLNITVTAEIDNASFCNTVELVKNLKSALRNL
ncbi:hypothetical protein ABZP36_010517 [Zizania latifolia]